LCCLVEWFGDMPLGDNAPEQIGGGSKDPVFNVGK
jgi:hypothetical protein